jgi:hypothetical protein
VQGFNLLQGAECVATPLMYALGRCAPLVPEALGFHSADLARYQPYNTWTP